MKKVVIFAENINLFELAVHNGPGGDIDRYMFGSAQKALLKAAEWAEEAEVILDDSAIAILISLTT